MKCLQALIVVALCVGSTPAVEEKSVTLANGKSFQVPVEKNLPLRFKNRKIRVETLGVTARITEDESAPPWIWILQADLKAKGDYEVTVTTPLDEDVVTSFEAAGRAPLQARFFPQAEYPTVWTDFQEPGVHWYPFHFKFREKGSGKEFEFTQWAQMDSKVLDGLKVQIDKARAMMRQMEEQESKKD